MLRLVGAGVTAMLFAAGCGGNSIDCATNGDCIQGGIPGVCLPSPSSSTHWCAFTDPSCPGGQRWGNAAGDDLARTCVAGVVPDGGPPDAAEPDARVDAMPEPDSGPPPALTTKIFVLVGSGANSMLVFDANTLASLGSATLPVSSPTHAEVAANTLWILGGTVTGDPAGSQHLTALDPTTLLLKPGYPKIVDCNLQNGLITKSGLYCVDGNATGEADDVVDLMTPPDFAFSKASSNTPSIFQAGGGDGLVLASYGGSTDKTVGVFDDQLAALAGSPVTATTPGPITTFAASKMLNRFAIADGTSVMLFDATTLLQVGATATYGSGLDGMRFDDEREQLVITIVGGDVTSRSSVDFSEKVPRVSRGAGQMKRPFIDPTRDRIYIVDNELPNCRLIVLDATTLAHVAGSPVTLTGATSTVDVAAF